MYSRCDIARRRSKLIRVFKILREQNYQTDFDDHTRVAICRRDFFSSFYILLNYAFLKYTSHRDFFGIM